MHIANSDKQVSFYSLDVIISAGYRVKALRDTQCRIWANQILKEYMFNYKDGDRAIPFDEINEMLTQKKTAEILLESAVLAWYTIRDSNPGHPD